MLTVKEDVLLISTADWDNPFWTNKQHVAVELSRLGHKVLYIDSLGLRSPSINSSDVSRILRRLVKAIGFPRQVQRNLWVWSPVVIPFQKYRFIRLLNKWLLGMFVRFFTYILGLKHPLIWTYNPLTLDMLHVCSNDKVIYHCVDEIKAQPDMPVQAIADAEEKLLKRADCVFVTSEKLYTSRKIINDNTFLFTNVADFEHFNRATSISTEVPQDLASLKKPVIGFVGAISSYKVDFGLLSYMALSRPDWSIVLIGKVGEGDPATDISLLQHDNIHILGPRAYEDLPGYLKGFDVAMIPVALNDYTHAMFPMKFFEYLAAGKRIVATNIDSLKAYRDTISIADSHADFVRCVDEILAAEDDAGLNQRLALARENTYRIRTESMLAMVNEITK